MVELEEIVQGEEIELDDEYVTEEEEEAVDKLLMAAMDSAEEDDDDEGSLDDDSDDDDDEFLNETFADRVAALIDIIPPTTRVRTVQAVQNTVSAVVSAATMAGKGAWVLTTSSLLVLLPLMLEIERETFAIQQENAQRLQAAQAAQNSQRSSDIFGLKESVQPRDVPSRRYRPDRNTSNVFGTNSDSMSAPISTPKKDHMASDIFWNDSRSATASAVAHQQRRSSAASISGGGLLSTQVDYEPSFHAPGSAEMRRSARQSPPMSASIGGDYNDYSSEPQQDLLQQQYDLPIATLEKQAREYELATATPSNVPRTPQRQAGPSSVPSPRYSASKNHHYHSNVFDLAPAPSFVPSVNVHNGGKNNYVSNIFNTEPSSVRGSVTEPDIAQKNGKRCYTQKNASSFGSSFLFSPQDELSASMRVAGRGRRSSDNVERESTLGVFDRNATRDAEQSRRLSAYKNSNSSSMADIMSWSGDNNNNNEGSLRRSAGGNSLRLDSNGGIRAGGLSSNDLNRDRQGKGRRSIGSMGSQGIF
ncbi:mitochondrial import receptor protein [Chytridiales sp. JEL 0842]|nr:mitochondrial import receptor protein [Chytridiales sp. JEL 0842]